MGKNVNRLGNQLLDRMKQTSQAAVPVTVEFGIINGDMSLSVDSINTPIPQEDYMISLHLAHDTYNTYEKGHSHSGEDHSHSGGEHVHRVPSVFRRLEPGDRVLVIWYGHEPVVVDIIVAGTTVESN